MRETMYIIEIDTESKSEIEAILKKKGEIVHPPGQNFDNRYLIDQVQYNMIFGKGGFEIIKEFSTGL